MGSKNTKVRKRMEDIFGKICMIEEAGIRKIPVEDRMKIKGYKVYDEQITYHHIKERSKGGRTTVENGGLLKGYNHVWLHSLSEKRKKEVNKAIQEYKLNFIQLKGNMDVVDSKSITVSIPNNEQDFIRIPLEDNTKEDYEKKRKFERAKVKREMQRKIDEELEEYYEDR